MPHNNLLWWKTLVRSRWPILAATLVCCGDDPWGHGLYVQEEGLTKTLHSKYTVWGPYQIPHSQATVLRPYKIPQCQSAHTVTTSQCSIRGLTRTPPHPGLAKHDNIPSSDRALPNPCLVLLTLTHWEPGLTWLRITTLNQVTWGYKLRCE